MTGSHAKPRSRKEKIMLKENKIAKLVVDAAYHVHTKLGPGLLLNFGAPLIKKGIFRIVNGLEE